MVVSNSEQISQAVSLNLSPVQVAKLEGIYRWTGWFDYTKYAEVGEGLPRYPRESSRRIFTGDAQWVLLKKDNMRSEDTIPIFVGLGIIHMIETNQLPEVGCELNILEASGVGLKTGLHRIVGIDENFQWGGESYFRIDVERIGDLSDKLPVHEAEQMTI